VTLPLRSFTLDAGLETDRPLAVIGPSGAGKSTLLRLIAGLVRPASGEVECGGRLWFGPGVDLAAERRRVGFLFQDYALFPHLSVRANVAFGAGGEDVDPLLERFGISHLRGARPRQLSGGERQRVALARALARRPTLLLLDEPLSALDPATRGSVAAELAGVLREAAVPALVVTHSYEEAVSLADRVAVIERGRIVQQGAGRELLEAPATPFVAEFAGTNLLAGVASGRRVTLDRGGDVHIADPAQGAVAVLVAPWQITVSHAVVDDSALNHISGRVERVVPLGNRVRVVVAGITAELTPESAARLELQPGAEAVVSWKATSSRILSRAADA
jgi:ABC-type sulfate/molybdate transport systems ATPase subunit